MASRTEANGTDRIIHKLDLNEYGLQDVPESSKQAAKQEVADYLLEETLRQVAQGQSPVEGEGRFRILSPEYAVREKGGRRTSDLELEGDLKDSLISQPAAGSFIDFGHIGSQVPKADGHNQLSTRAKDWAKQSGMPKRRYIPDDGQKFDNRIVGNIRRILDEFQRTAPRREQADDIFDDEDETIRPQITVNNPTSRDLFSDDVIGELLEEAFRRRGLF